MSKKILIIIPAYNEEDCILNVYNEIMTYNKKNRTNYDVIVINDGSIDETENILINNKIPHIRLIQNLGIGGAVQTGYKYAYENNYDVAIQYDADGQHDINYVKNLINPIMDNKANMVIGSRFKDKNTSKFKSTFARRVGIKILSNFMMLLTRKRIHDVTSGFRASDKKIIELFANNYAVEYPEPVSEVTVLKKRFKVLEVPVEMHERKGGSSSIHSWKNVYFMINVMISMFAESIKRYK